MSLRYYDKDHASNPNVKGAGASELLAIPNSENPLQFWAKGVDKIVYVDLQEFSDGHGVMPEFGAFTGRPKLIRQIAPEINTSMTGLSSGAVRLRLTMLRAWWKLFDSFDTLLNGAESFHKVDEVCDITRFHCEYAKQIGIRVDLYTRFLGLVNAVLAQLGKPSLVSNIAAPARRYRYLPTESQVSILRVGMKQAWEAVKKKWLLHERIRSVNFMPQSGEEEELLRNWLYFHHKQEECNCMLPTSNQLRNQIESKHFSTMLGLNLLTMRSVAFPTTWDANTAFHMCLSGTGWNPAVLYSLSVSDKAPFLQTNMYDTTRYILTGKKARAQGKEQVVTGLWKTSWGPGPIIRDYLEKVKPLRGILESELLVAQDKLKELKENNASDQDLVKQHNVIKTLEFGCRSVWLFVNRNGEIGWLTEGRTRFHYLDGKQVPYLHVLISRINDRRARSGDSPIELVTASDFRDIFALYVWRQSGGNILAVMRVLNHFQLKTTQGYLDNNILNNERDDQLRSFLNNLFVELDKGRLDITILAHLHRYGSLPEELESRLVRYRALEKSRLDVACLDPFNPPRYIQPPTSGAARRCSTQRCLLCAKNAIILPESLSGIAMRAEEVIAIQARISVQDWLVSSFSEELDNCLVALSVFPEEEVSRRRKYWANAILNGTHRVPGLLG
ncbi:hypothetical protein [Pseudomonas sp. S2_H01]